MGLLSSAARVVVLNSHTQLLASFDKVLVLRGGKLVAAGRYQDLVADNVPELALRQAARAPDAAAAASRDLSQVSLALPSSS